MHYTTDGRVCQAKFNDNRKIFNVTLRVAPRFGRMRFLLPRAEKGVWAHGNLEFVALLLHFFSYNLNNYIFMRLQKVTADVG